LIQPSGLPARAASLVPHVSALPIGSSVIEKVKQRVVLKSIELLSMRLKMELSYQMRN